MTHCVKRTKSWQKRCLYLILGRRSCKHVLEKLQFVSKNYNNVKYIKVFHELSLQWNCPSALGLERDSASSMAWVFLLCGPQDSAVVGCTGWVRQGLFSLKRLELCHLERCWFQILFRSSTASSQFWPNMFMKNVVVVSNCPPYSPRFVSAKDGRSTMLPTWTAEQASHGSAMVPVAQYRQATRTSSPTRDRAKAPGPPGGPPGMTGGTLPQGVPMAPMAAPGMPNVSGVPVMPMAPVMIQRVKSSAPIQRSSSPDRRYF